MPPPSDIRDAAAAAAVGTTPVETPGFDRWSSLKMEHCANCKVMFQQNLRDHKAVELTYKSSN